MIEMLARYRRLRDEQGFGWGEDALPDFFRWARFSALGPAFAEFATSGDWSAAVRAAIGTQVPAGLVVVAVADDGGLSADSGPPRPAIRGTAVAVDVVLDSTAGSDEVVTVAGQDIPVAAGGTGLVTLDLDAATPDITIRHADETLVVTGVLTPTPAATLRLTAPHGARWSVTDTTGGAWFAEGVPRKWDARHRPFFHAGTVDVAVPAAPLHVVAARGLEFERQEFDVSPAPGGTVEVEYRPVRRFDPAAQGWYGGDMHVHLNYSGDLVLTPADAARMQVGEGLHLMNLAAGNLGGSLVYDRELLESTAGTDLWSGGSGAEQVVARAGLEYRNDLLGHVHGLGLTAMPPVLHTGHEGSDRPWDWPPNSVACAHMQELGATTTYAHPVYSPLTDPDDLYGPYRSVEARELVADAALGVVDAIELVSCFDDRGAVVMYHRLLSCGLRLSAAAGTDAFLSFAHGPGVASNPPGWGRVYAQLGAEPLSVAAFQDAVRAGRTVVTNGPWLTLDVDGHGPGAVLHRRPGDRLVVRAHRSGSGVDRLVLHGPDGELAGTGGDVLGHEVVVGEGGLWLAAAAYGGDDPHTLGAPVFAHTSPVYVDVAGQRVARSDAARWCLGLLDRLQALATEHGRFDPDRRTEQLGDLTAVIGRARAFYERVAAA
ncbi:hypothetical protein CFP66_04145 [Pseudonocardia sp. MH-G8]|nr:hypothetical protein CFP66_04145 [Pseudonocardia sp. MH-G8]